MLKWNFFTADYKEAPASETIVLTENKTAITGDNNAFGLPGASGITIDGAGNALNSANYENLGFSLNAVSATFKNISFENFLSTGNGGAIQAVSSAMVNFTGIINFTGNISTGVYDSGGAIYNYNSEINFTNGNINFTNNSANNLGGAISNYDISEMNFTNGNVNFTGNSAMLAGAIYNYNSGMNFTNGNINFTSNIAVDGGAIANVYNSTMNFTGVNVNFTGNRAIIFNSSPFIGGAVVNIENSIINFTNASVDFTSNNADSGAAIVNYDRAEINFTGGSVNFTSNSASDFGGAISNAYNSIITFADGKTNFTGNVAVSSGGAIYMAGNSAITFKALNENIELTFKDNYANNVLNDIYTYNGGFVNFEANGRNITLTDGIKITGNGTTNKAGNGDLIFQADSEILGKFNINGGSAKLADNVTLKGKEIIVGAAGTLDLQNNSVNTIKTEKFETSGNLKIDIFQNGDNDKIEAQQAILRGNLDIKARVGKYENKEYEIIITSQNIINISANASGNYSGLNYTLDTLNYSDYNVLKLIVNGTYSSSFGEIGGLTFNQKETAKALDKLSVSGAISQAFESFISDYDAKTQEEQEEMLRQTSGYFLANIIRNAAADSPNNEIYDKIKSRDEGASNSGIWAQIKGGQEIFKGDENSIDDYKDSSIGAMFGFDKYIQEKSLMWGVYARINKDNIEQGENKADGQKSGLGVYGGYIKEKYEVKAMLLGSYDIFNTQRQVLGQTAKSDISAITISADAEGAMKFELSKEMQIRPYIGVEAAAANYGNFKESGTDANLDINAGSYIRSAARIGAGIEYEKERISVYAKTEGKCLLSGTEPEIESVFENTDETFKSRGTKEGSIEIGIAAGMQVEIAKDWKGYANVNYYGAQNYTNIYGNIGIKYLFGKNAK
ncbi:MAG: autotransporter domain-containing protein [Endomicrobium sp.]|jgi:predicted outer membrane repeat protein|nr:autotransporter domain-containing protein [Endomicrobium sp.]